MRKIRIFDTISFHMVLLLAPLLELSECRMISDFCFSLSVLSCRLYRHHLENKIKLNNHQMAPLSHFYLNGFTIRCQAYQAFYVSGVRINSYY